MWQKDAAKAWPVKDNAKAYELYKNNEIRYLAPAMKARNPEIRNYLMSQLDPSCRSGIGLFNVRWHTNVTIPVGREKEGPLSMAEIERLRGFPKHLVALLNENHTDVLMDMLRHTLPRQK